MVYAKQNTQENTAMLKEAKELLLSNSPRAVDAILAGRFSHIAMNRIKGDKMRKLILLCLVAILLIGCKGVNEVLYAVANDKRVKTKIIQDKHNQATSDSRALTQKRLELKDTLYNMAMVSVVVLGIWGNIAGVYWLLGSVHIGLQKKRFMFIDDPQQLRFPLLMRGDNVADVSTGRGFQITDKSLPSRMLTESSTAVQLRLDKHTRGRSEIVEIR